MKDLTDQELFEFAQRHLAKATKATQEAIDRAHALDNASAWCDLREVKESMDKACRLGICAGEMHIPDFTLRGPGGK